MELLVTTTALTALTAILGLLTIALADELAL